MFNTNEYYYKKNYKQIWNYGNKKFNKIEIKKIRYGRNFNSYFYEMINHHCKWKSIPREVMLKKFSWIQIVKSENEVFIVTKNILV